MDIGNSTFASCSEFNRSVSRTAFNSSSGFEGSGDVGVCASKTAEVEITAASSRRVSLVDIWDYYRSFGYANGTTE